MTRRLLGEVQHRLGQIPRRELLLLLAAMAIGLAIRMAYVLITKDHVLAGDEIEYDLEARFIEMGNWFWSTTPFREAGPSIWKAPGYPAWVGIWYELLGPDPDRVLLVQTFLGPVTIGLSWALARRLFGPAVAVATAFLVAVYPFAWQVEARLYTEALVTPLTLLALLLVLDRAPSPRLVAAAGLVCGAVVLTRPASVWLLGGVVVAVLAAAWPARGRGLALAAVAAGVAVLCVAPWTYRNYDLTGEFVPISVQDAALYGVFNEEAAGDPVYPWAWRPVTRRDYGLFTQRPPLPLPELRRRLRQNAFDYIEEHPSSVPKAYYWNGIRRLWDLRRPSLSLVEVQFEGRSRSVTKVGLGMYYVLLPLALYGLWRLRRRPVVLVPLLVMAFGASVVHISDAGTRYRAPFEPLIVMLACSGVAALAGPRLSASRRGVEGPRPEAA